MPALPSTSELRPGDSVAAAEAWVRAAVAPFSVAVTRGNSLEASSPSRPEGPAFRCLSGVLHELLPEAAMVPYVSPNDTNFKHFATLADEQIRFLPLVLGSADLGLIHGTNERIEVRALHRLIAFYRRLIPAFDATDDPPDGGRAP